MKTLLLLLGATLFSLVGISQSNNPFNKRGIDFQTSINIIQTDYYAGKVKEFNAETIDRYKKLIPLTVQTDLNMANKVISSIKDPGYSFQKALSQSKLSVLGKEVLNLMINPKNLDLRSYRQQLVKKVDEIKVASIPSDEREFLFTVVAISYNMARDEKPKQDCTVDGIYGETTVPCWVSGAVHGALIGYDYCGIWCAVGGAVVGAISGAFS